MGASAIAGLGLNIANQAAGGVMGMLLQKHNDKRQLEQQGKLQRQQMEGSKEMMDYQQNAAYDMWQKTGAVGQMEQLKKAGLNPALMYEGGGAGGQSVQPTAQVQGGQAPQGGREIQDMMAMQLQNRMMNAQIKVAESQAIKNTVEAEKTAGVDTDLGKQNVINATLESVIKEYTGKEAKAQYEEVKQPTRGEEARKYYDETVLASSVAQAQSYIVKDMTNQELEMKLLQNAKTREEVKNLQKAFDQMEETLKGQKLSNIILELESKLQTQTGLDKGSAGWMKVLGRLFIGLTQ